jgi:hypothetical protein
VIVLPIADWPLFVGGLASRMVGIPAWHAQVLN